MDLTVKYRWTGQEDIEEVTLGRFYHDFHAPTSYERLDSLDFETPKIKRPAIGTVELALSPNTKFGSGNAWLMGPYEPGDVFRSQICSLFGPDIEQEVAQILALNPESSDHRVVMYVPPPYYRFLLYDNLLTEMSS